jgi:hypothetical protein
MWSCFFFSIPSPPLLDSGVCTAKDDLKISFKENASE